MKIYNALLMALSMFWEVGWSLVLGFLISASVQVLAPRDKLQKLLGGEGVKQLAIATGLGAASSSCSYASASVARSLFHKGASLTTSLAFLFASTNLVIELGIVIFLLLGWQFMVAEWLGGILLIVVMSALVKLTVSKEMIVEARAHVAMTSKLPQRDNGHASPSLPSTDEKIRAIAEHMIMDVRMLWKDIVIGFLIAGFLSTFVSMNTWQSLFVVDAPAPVQIVLNALIGPLIAMVSFVCSIGNIPMAAVLWNSGISFSGVLSFIYADLIVLPLLDVYRRYFGIRMAVYIGIVFYVTMVISGILMDILFAELDLIPQTPPFTNMSHGHFAVNATLWLNLVFGSIAITLFYKYKKALTKPMACCGGMKSPDSPSRHMPHN